MSEQDERMTVRGPQGPKGNRGEQGGRGQSGPALSRSARRALAYMFILNLLLVVGVYLWLGHEVTVIANNAAASTRQAAATAAENNRQRCLSLQQDVKIPVQQPVTGNPSREFDARLEAVDRMRMRQLRCPGSGK